MADSAQDKTEKPSAKRLRDARQRGQVARSRELSTALVTGVAVVMLFAFGGAVSRSALVLMQSSLTFDPALLDDRGAIAGRLLRTLGAALMAVMPLLLATLLAALCAPALLGGWNFSTQALKPDFSRLNPLSGLARIASSQGLFELGKGLLKFGFIGAIGFFYVWSHRDDLLALSALELRPAIGAALSLLLWAMAWMCAALAAIAAVDAPWQWWSHHKKLRMTRQEVRDEHKESEGRPEVKARIRQLQHAMASRRMMEKVPTADVIITNPTHYAVALRYAGGKRKAPIVVAKGAGVIAAAIRELAQQHRVPLVSAPPLARALYRDVDLDREIPLQLYQAVAQVLGYIYQLRAWRGGTPPPVMGDIGEVPNGQPD